MTLLPGRKSTLGQLLEGNNLERLLAGFDSNDEDKRALYSVAAKVVAKVAQVCKEKDLDEEATAADSAKQRFLLKILATYSSTVS